MTGKKHVLDRAAWLAELMEALARHCLWHGRPESVEEAVNAIEKALEATFEQAQARELPGEDFGAMFCRSCLLACLNQANAVYGYPYSDREICRDLLPAWQGVFAALSRPAALCAAFQGHYREWEDFPLPSQIMAWMPDTAFRKNQRRDDARISPGYGRELCQSLLHKWRNDQTDPERMRDKKENEDSVSFGNVLKFKKIAGS